MIEPSSLLGWKRGWVVKVYYSVYFNAAIHQREAGGLLMYNTVFNYYTRG